MPHPDALHPFDCYVATGNDGKLYWQIPAGDGQTMATSIARALGVPEARLRQLVVMVDGLDAIPLSPAQLSQLVADAHDLGRRGMTIDETIARLKTAW